MAAPNLERPVPRSTRYPIEISRSSLECMISQGHPVDVYWTVVLPGRSWNVVDELEGRTIKGTGQV